MGNTQTQSSEDNFLSEYEQVRRENGGIVITHRQNETNYFLREFSYADKKQFQAQLNKFKNLQLQEPNESLLNVIKVCSKEFTNFCSNTYKIYTVYQYPSVTLQEQINARRKEQKYFEECELWAILQSCVNALSEIKPIIALHPTLVFIVPDGLLKVINNDMITEDHRCIINENVYYAPEKINNFHKADHENSLKKQSIFSLGMTILNAALLQPVNNCYDYQKYEFIESTLEQHIEKLVGKYSEQFIQILAMILEPNQSKRSSLIEVKELLSQVWNSTDEEGQTSKSHSKILEKSIKRLEQVQQSRNNGSEFLRQTYVDSQRFTPFPSQRESRPILNEKSANVPSIPGNKQNLFTDPKLLQMIRKDLQSINQQRKAHNSQITSVDASIRPSSNSQFNFSLHEPLQVNTSGNELSQPQMSENVVTEEDGIRYEGYMLNGKRYGFGKLFYPDGAYYEGEFREGLLWGKGTLFYGPDKPAYEGDWVQDHFEGYGKLYNDNIKDLNGGFNYEDFDNVEDFWLFYEGDFKNDYKEGRGKFVLSNGEYFEGEFHNDSINGRGVFRTAENEKVEGIWENNVLVRLIQ